MSSTVDANLQPDSSRIIAGLSSFKNNMGDCAQTAKSFCGRAITTAASHSSDFVKAVVEKSPIGTVITGIVITACSVRQIRIEWHYKGIDDQFSRNKLIASIALAGLGAGITALGCLGLYGFSQAGTSNPVLTNATDINCTNSTLNSTLASVVENVTIPVSESVSAPVCDAVKEALTNASIVNHSSITMLVDTTPLVVQPEVLAEVVPQVAPAVSFTFDNQTMCAIQDKILAETAMCEVPNVISTVFSQQLLDFPKPIEYQAPKKGMFDGFTGIFGWVKSKLKAD